MKKLIFIIVVILCVVLSACKSNAPFLTPTVQTETTPSTETESVNTTTTTPVTTVYTTEPTSSFPTHTHSYEKTVVEATCTEDGYSYYYCDCGSYYTDSIVAALGHDYIEREQNYKCTRCNRYEDEGFTFTLITSDMSRYNDLYLGLEDTYFVKSASALSVENGHVSIPRKHMGYPVSGMLRGSLYNIGDKITNIFIPGTIKYIGSSLFTYDGSFGFPTNDIILKSIVFADDCKDLTISHTCFQWCKSVSDISMPNNCISKLNHDDMVRNHFPFEDTQYYKTHRHEKDGCFYLFGILTETDKSKLNSKVSIEDGTTIIANCAFEENTNIKSVELPASIIYIGESAFERCVNLSTIIYNGTKSDYKSIFIEDTAFEDCKTITYHFN